jgi:hypothetical protein
MYKTIVVFASVLCATLACDDPDGTKTKLFWKNCDDGNCMFEWEGIFDFIQWEISLETDFQTGIKNVKKLDFYTNFIFFFLNHLKYSAYPLQLTGLVLSNAQTGQPEYPITVANAILIAENATLSGSTTYNKVISIKC